MCQPPFLDVGKLCNGSQRTTLRGLNIAGLNFAVGLIRKIRIFCGDLILRISFFQEYRKIQFFILLSSFWNSTLTKKAIPASMGSCKITIKLFSVGKNKNEILRIALSWIFKEIKFYPLKVVFCRPICILYTRLILCLTIDQINYYIKISLETAGGTYCPF